MAQRNPAEMPRYANAFLVINLGCEMLYVIDQRLKAQSITVEKSAQVLRDLTFVLLDPKLLDQLILTSPSFAASAAKATGAAAIQPITADASASGTPDSPALPPSPPPPLPPKRNAATTVQQSSSSSPRRQPPPPPPSPPPPLLSHPQCRRLLGDVACCSLMRLDAASMDKLWDLTVMVLKWQIALLNTGSAAATGGGSAQPLLDLTFRHMDGIARLLPEQRKQTLIDCTKRHLIECWDQMTEDQRRRLFEDMQQWLRPFAVKISLLIRLGFQRPDATFERDVDSEFFRYYADHVGENVYMKHAYVTTLRANGGGAAGAGNSRKGASRNRLRLNAATSTVAASSADAEADQQSHEIDALAAQLQGVTTIGRPKNTPQTSASASPVKLKKSHRKHNESDQADPTTAGETASASSKSSASHEGDPPATSASIDPAAATDVFGAENGILDEVVFDLDAYNRKRRADLRMAGETIITIDSRDSEFEHVQRTCASLDAIIDRFSLDFFRPLGDVGIIEELDCTRELLRLLDEG